jgi:hypothetical protein
MLDACAELYRQHDYAAEVKAAFEKWSEHIDALMTAGEGCRAVTSLWSEDTATFPTHERTAPRRVLLYSLLPNCLDHGKKKFPATVHVYFEDVNSESYQTFLAYCDLLTVQTRMDNYPGRFGSPVMLDVKFERYLPSKAA